MLRATVKKEYMWKINFTCFKKFHDVVSKPRTNILHCNGWAGKKVLFIQLIQLKTHQRETQHIVEYIQWTSSCRYLMNFPTHTTHYLGVVDLLFISVVILVPLRNKTKIKFPLHTSRAAWLLFFIHGCESITEQELNAIWECDMSWAERV